MAHAPSYPAEVEVDRGQLVHPTVQAPPITPGKVAMWLFLATEVMFFTGLIGSYVVLRCGSPPTGYSWLAPPATDLAKLPDLRGVEVHAVGPNRARVAELIHEATGRPEHDIEHELHAGHAAFGVSNPAEAAHLASALTNAGARAEVMAENRVFNWPKPYDHQTNPLSIDLTALNTFILICSSVTMVLALSAVQRGDQRWLKLYLLATVLIGSVFLGIQVYEYRSLMFVHHYPIGISRTGHFTPDVSLFASCFFTMTGFHGAHVTGGVILLICILVGAMQGRFTDAHHSPVELAGLYWHFVDLVWIILFTVVYLI